MAHVIPSMVKLAFCKLAAAISFFAFGALVSVEEEVVVSVVFSLHPANNRIANKNVNIDFPKFISIGFKWVNYSSHRRQN
jgi:hypothetical protein